MTDLKEDALREKAAALLLQAGLPPMIDFTPLPGGANNRVFLVENDQGRALLKAYFHHPDDPRDRLGAEFAFLEYAWAAGLRQAPRAIARDDESHLALYEFVEGRPCEAKDVTAGTVHQAAQFFRELNALRLRESAERLPRASDACFSLADHRGLVEKRLSALQKVEEKPARELIAKVSATWKAISSGLDARWKEAGADPRAELPPSERVVSPSDFGFHNALVDADERLRFVDFEYAGLDDAAKMAADFFSQPAVPVARAHYAAFAREAFQGLIGAERLRRRVAWVMPIHRLKWICLMLNDFLPAARERRLFARGGDPEQRKAEQLEKARRALENIDESLTWPV